MEMTTRAARSPSPSAESNDTDDFTKKPRRISWKLYPENIEKRVSLDIQGIEEGREDDDKNEKQGDLAGIVRSRVEECGDKDGYEKQDGRDRAAKRGTGESKDGNGNEEQSNFDRESRRRTESDDSDQIDEKDAMSKCLILRKPVSSKKGEMPSWEKYAMWRKKKYGVVKLAKQLKARWGIEESIEEQLQRFQVRYNRDKAPNKLKDISEFLMPESIPPLELASVSWLGDWRPSAILKLLAGLTCSSVSSSTSNSEIFQRRLKQLINEIHIEEAIIDAEMAEIQATCIFSLPFSPTNILKPHSAAFSCIQSEFKKIDIVTRKAQLLRFKTLDLIVKKVLNQTRAAEFLVAFARIQDVIHKRAKKQKLPRGPVILSSSLKSLAPPPLSQVQEPTLSRESFV